MALAYRATPVVTSGATVTLTTGTAVGDLIVLFVADTTGGGKTLGCTGFTSQATAAATTSTALLTRVADGTEGTTVTLTTTGTAANLRSVLVTVTGGAVAGPASAYSSTAATTIPVPSITVAAPNSWLLWFCRTAAASPVLPSGFTTVSSFSSTSYCCGDNETVSTGATGTETGTCSSSIAQGALLAINIPGTAYSLASATADGSTSAGALTQTMTMTGAAPDGSVSAGTLTWLGAGRVGVFLSGVQTGAANFAASSTLWQTWTGVSPPAARYYLAASTFTYFTDLQQMVTAGVKICLTLRPAYNPVSSTDLANLTTLLQTLQTAGANVDVTLWHEPYFEGLTAAQYIAAVAYYGPTVRTYFPLIFCTAISSVVSHNENSYYPGDASIDKICTDIYNYNYASQGDALDAAAAVANSAVPQKPFGIWEFNTSTDPANGQTQTSGTTFFSYIQSYMTGRLTAGLQNADVLLFDSNQANFLGNGASQNAGFEGGIGAWAMYPSTGNCAVAATTVQAHTGGTGSLAMTSTASGAMAAYCALGSTSGMPVVASSSLVSVQAWFRAATTARTCQVNILWYSSAGTLLSTSPGTAVTDTTSGWTQVTLAGVTAPASAAYALPQTQVNGTAAGEVHYAEDAALFISNPPPCQTTVIDFPWDWRIAAWSSLYTALNAVPISGISISGHATSVSTTTGSFTSAMVLSGTAPDGSTSAGTLGQALAVTGTAPDGSISAGTFTWTAALAGTADSTVTASTAGTLTWQAGVAGTAASASAGVGVLAWQAVLTGTAAGLSATTGAFAGTGALTGTAVTVPASAGVLTSAMVLLAGTADSTVTDSTAGVLAWTVTLAATSATSTAAAGSLAWAAVLTGTAATATVCAASIADVGGYALLGAGASSSAATGAFTQVMTAGAATVTPCATAGTLAWTAILAGTAPLVSAYSDTYSSLYPRQQTATGTVAVLSAVAGTAVTVTATAGGITAAVSVTGTAAAATGGSGGFTQAMTVGAAAASSTATSGGFTGAIALTGTAATVTAGTGIAGLAAIDAGTASTATVTAGQVTMTGALTGAAASASGATGAFTSAVAVTGTAGNPAAAASTFIQVMAAAGTAATGTGTGAAFTAATGITGAADSSATSGSGTLGNWLATGGTAFTFTITAVPAVTLTTGTADTSVYTGTYSDIYPGAVTATTGTAVTVTVTAGQITKPAALAGVAVTVTVTGGGFTVRFLLITAGGIVPQVVAAGIIPQIRAGKVQV